MGQYFSLQTLVQVAMGRPYIDVFGVEEEEEEEENKKHEKETPFESAERECVERNEPASSNVVLRLSKNQVRRTARFDE